MGVPRPAPIPVGDVALATYAALFGATVPAPGPRAPRESGPRPTPSRADRALAVLPPTREPLPRWLRRVPAEQALGLMREDLPTTALHELTRHPDLRVRLAVAEHPDTPVDVLETLLTSSADDSLLARTVGVHPAAPLALRLEVAGMLPFHAGDPLARRLVALLPEQHVPSLLTRPGSAPVVALAADERTPADTVAALIPELPAARAEPARQGLARRSDLPGAVARTLLATGGLRVLDVLARNPHLPAATALSLSRRVLAGEFDGVLGEHVWCHPELPPLRLRAAAESCLRTAPTSRRLRQLLRNPSLPEAERTWLVEWSGLPPVPEQPDEQTSAPEPPAPSISADRTDVATAWCDALREATPADRRALLARPKAIEALGAATVGDLPWAALRQVLAARLGAAPALALAAAESARRGYDGTVDGLIASVLPPLRYEPPVAETAPPPDERPPDERPPDDQPAPVTIPLPRAEPSALDLLFS